ncbi:MAG: hypothetical protein LLF94_06440 [Chlamydiales bacterium]|nr:hypothetical protein [Chlamydiales bacterium]
MKKRPFSIVEVMIAFGIITICAAAFVFNFQKSSQERREKDSLNLVESKFRMAAQLAKITGRRVQVVFDKENDKKNVCISSDINVPERMKITLSRKADLPYVKDIEISPKEADENAVSFYPWGLEDKDTMVTLFVTSGDKLETRVAKFAPSVESVNAKEIDDLFPYEIAENEKEEKHVHVD